jgi:lysophospholipase L1-like esterase
VRIAAAAPDDRLRVLIDGTEKAVLAGTPRADMTIAGLPAGDHVVRLEKQSETQGGSDTFYGFFPADGATPLPAPPPRARQIEFIGDSYTVGYGNTSQTTQCTPAEIHDRTDSQRAFGPLAARALGADYRVIAYSGFGMVRNYDGGVPGSSLPALFDRAIPGESATRDDRPGWVPLVIVVNLGTNDFSTPLPAGEAWPDEAALRDAYRRRYVDFIRTLHARDPRARFILMGSERFFADVTQVARTLGANGISRVTPIAFTGLAYSACDSHPSLADDEALSKLVVGAIGTDPKVWAR